MDKFKKIYDTIITETSLIDVNKAAKEVIKMIDRGENEYSAIRKMADEYRLTMDVGLLRRKVQKLKGMKI